MKPINKEVVLFFFINESTQHDDTQKRGSFNVEKLDQKGEKTYKQ